MTDSKRRKLRWTGLLFPPAGLILTWTQEGMGWPKRLLNSLFLLLYAVPYAVVVLCLLLWTTPLSFEWRGGFPPVLTFSKTVPDYDAVEAHREDSGTSGAQGEPLEGGAFWTGFRGPDRDGHYTEQPILLDWPENGLEELWRVPVGGGYASMAVAEGRIFTLEQRRDEEVIAAYALASGDELWTHAYPAQFNDEFRMGGEGPRATPTWHAGRVYSLGAEGDFKCLDAGTGDVLWERNPIREQDASVLTFGSSASPLIVDDKVLVVGGAGGNALLAYDRESGEPIWTAVAEKAAYASPMEVVLAGRRQILLVTADHAVGVTIEDGEVLWRFPWTVQHDNSIAQPVVTGPDRFVLSGGYGTGAVAVEIQATPQGWKAIQVWRNRYLKNKFTSSVHHDGHLYGLDESILTCLDAGTGERMWKDGRYNYGQVLLASGHLVVLSGMGDLALVVATPERHVELARFEALPGKTWNHPAMADGRLLVRNAVEMACYRIGASTD